MSILRIKDENGNVQDVLALRGATGKSAYQSAKDGGYTGTEEEFNVKLANEYTNNSALVTTLILNVPIISYDEYLYRGYCSGYRTYIRTTTSRNPQLRFSTQGAGDSNSGTIYFGEDALEHSFVITTISDDLNLSQSLVGLGFSPDHMELFCGIDQVIDLDPGATYTLYAYCENGYFTTGYELDRLDERVRVLEGFICLRQGTQILMGDGTTKNIEDVKYNDVVKGWDFDNNCQINVKSYGVVKTGIANYWQTHVFENGEILEIYKKHPIYSKTDNIMKSSDQLVAGEMCMDVNGDDCALVNVYGVVDNEFTNRYMLLTENSTYFANGILSGHTASARMKVYSLGIKLFNENITEEELELFKATGNVYAEDTKAKVFNREYLKEVAPHLGRFNKATRTMAAQKKKLSSLDYKTVKYQQGKLSQEEYEACCATCDEARAVYNEEEAIKAECSRQIKLVKEKFGFRTKTLSEKFIEAYNIDMAHVRKNGLN